MINRWILRYRLWWHGVCPLHGEINGYARGVGQYCEGCEGDKPLRRTQLIKRLQREYRAACFTGPEDAR